MFPIPSLDKVIVYISKQVTNQLNNKNVITHNPTSYSWEVCTSGFLCLNTYLYANVDVILCACKPLCGSSYPFVCMRVYVCVCKHLYVTVFTCLYTYACMCVYVRKISVCMPMLSYICEFSRTCNLYR